MLIHVLILNQADTKLKKPIDNPVYQVSRLVFQFRI